MRQSCFALALVAALLAAGCDSGVQDKPLGPVDPIPGPAGAVAPAGNTVPQGGTPLAAAPRAPSGGDKTPGGTSAESKMPPEGSGTGKSVQESSAHGATTTTEEKKK